MNSSGIISRLTGAALAAVLVLPVADALAQTANNVVCDGCVDTRDIAKQAVGTGKLAFEAVTERKIAPEAVTADKLDEEAVTTAKIDDGAVTSDKLAAKAVRTPNLADRAVSKAKLKRNSVGTDKILDGAVTADKLAADARFPPIGGDGSAGDLDVVGIVSWITSPPTNPNFGDVTINPGASLTVPAGTTIRCAGDLVNLGVIVVEDGARNRGRGFNTADDVSWAMIGESHPGDAQGKATRGDWHNDSLADPKAVDGGFGGIGIPAATAVTSFDQFRIGGGSGTGHASGANAGGLVRIYCNGSVSNQGTIIANGDNGSTGAGGGGGGIVVLASQVAVDNSTGTIQAHGGNGGSSLSWGGPGGGGGGGIVMMIAPSLSTVGGSVDVAGGTAGSNASTGTTNTRVGGGGGGASGGDGGDGGGVSSAGTVGTADPGLSGYTLEIQANPATLIR